MSTRRDQIILNHVFKINSGTSPDYMIEHFVPASSLYSYSTRFREYSNVSLLKVKSLVRSILFIRDVFYGMNYQTELNKYKIV